MRIKADFELRCHEYEGVEAIKAALLAGETKSRGGCGVKVKTSFFFFTHKNIIGIMRKVRNYRLSRVRWLYYHVRQEFRHGSYQRSFESGGRSDHFKERHLQTQDRGKLALLR